VTERLTMPTRVMISGSVPPEVELAAHGGDAARIEGAVREVAKRVLAAGGQILHGNHPSITDIVERVALPPPVGQPRRVHLFTSWYFLPEGGDQQLQAARGTYADITVTGAADMDRTPEAKEAALGPLRRAMIEAADAVVCIGGRLHEGEPDAPGVLREFRLAEARGLPVYLVGAGGGYTRSLYEQEVRGGVVLRNGLTVEENAHLATAADPWHAARLIVGDLERLSAARAELPAATADVEHLKMIEAIISRLAGNSFSIKGWSLTLVAALLALAGKGANSSYAVVALIPATFFWGLDAYYLALERRFRALYALVDGEGPVPPAQKSVKPYVLDPTRAPAAARETLWRNCRRGAVYGFHLPLMATVILIAVLAWSGALGSGVEPSETPAKPVEAKPARTTAGG
jgi:hypothetical protein